MVLRDLPPLPETLLPLISELRTSETHRLSTLLSPRESQMLSDAIQRINLDFHLFSPLAKTRRHMKFAEKQLRNDGDAKNLQRIILTIENCQFSFGGYDGCNF